MGVWDGSLREHHWPGKPRLGASVEAVTDTPQPLAGRRIWQQSLRAAPPGDHVFLWEGTYGSGGRVGAGIYLVRYTIGARHGTFKIARL